MQGCLLLVAVVIILATLKSVWEWLSNGGAVSIGSVLLWVVIGLAALYLFALAGQYIESLWRAQKRNRLLREADSSPEAKERYVKYLENEEKRLQRIQEFELDQAIKRASKEEDRDKLSRWRSAPVPYLTGKLREAQTPCSILTVLPGRQAFIAISENESCFVLGRVSKTGEIVSTESIRGSEIIDIESGVNVETTSRSRGTGGLITFGGFGIGSINSTTTIRTEVKSSYILVTTASLHAPIKHIVLSSAQECTEWVARIRVLVANQG